MVYQDLTGGYPLFRVLERGVAWHAVPVDGEPFTIPEIGGLRFTAVLRRSEVRRLEEADCLLVDGTVWTDNELARRGISARCAREMGHRPLSGEGGMLSVLGREAIQGWVTNRCYQASIPTPCMAG